MSHNVVVKSGTEAIGRKVILNRATRYPAAQRASRRNREDGSLAPVLTERPLQLLR